MIRVHNENSCNGKLEKVAGGGERCLKCGAYPSRPQIALVTEGEFNRLHELTGEEAVCCTGVIPHNRAGNQSSLIAEVTCELCIASIKADASYASPPRNTCLLCKCEIAVGKTACDDCMMHAIESVRTPEQKARTGTNVDHPAHYGGEKNQYETIKVIEAWKLGFCLGNAIKYISRADHKGHSVEDLEKAIWYIRREIAARKGDL